MMHHVRRVRAKMTWKHWVAVHSTLLLSVFAALLVFSVTVHEVCQHKEKQFGAVAWGQTVLADRPTYKTCLDRVLGR